MPVEFDETLPTSSRPAVSKKLSLFSRLVIKTGLVKTEAGAQSILLIIALLALLGSAFFFNASTQAPPAPTLNQLVP